MKKIRSTVFTIGIILTVLFLTGCEDDSNEEQKHFASQYEGKLLILQAYGSADNAAGATHSFVELYNTTSGDIDLNGINLYYANGISGINISEDLEWKKIPLTGTIPAEGSFLVLGPNQGSTGARYKIEEKHGDNYGDINNNDFILSNRSFKIALIEGSAVLNMQNPFNADGNGKKVSGYIDMVGAVNNPGAASPDNIFGYETAPARNSASEAVRRKNLTDTDNNQGASETFPDGKGDFISIRYASGSGGMTNDMLDVRYPRNSKAGKWDPFASPLPPEGTEMLMIWQIGAATDGNINRSFVELYNNTNSPINLNTYSLQYASGFSSNANGDPEASLDADAPWKKIDLTGTIMPRCSFLIIGEAQTASDPTNYPALTFNNSDADIYFPTFKLNNRAVKVALMENQTLLTAENPFTAGADGKPVAGYIDMVGASNGTTNNNTSASQRLRGFEGGGHPSNLTKQVGIRRKELLDSNDNATDFDRIQYANLVTRQGTAPNDTIVSYSPEYERFRPKNLAHGAWDPTTGEQK
jgi:hypothetical protein